jgi:hypothetical protein
VEYIRFGRSISACAAGFLLSACSFSNGVLPAPFQVVAVSKSTSSGALLYVANDSVAAGVSIVTFPQGKVVGTITNIGYPRGVCADTSGHVWITAYLHGKTFALYEFARGATTPLHTVRKKAQFNGCTVDQRGNVVVLTANQFVGSLEIWPPSLQGRPRVIKIPIDPLSAVFDDRGNLYIKGFSGSDPEFGELPEGSKKMTFLGMKRGGYFASDCVGWDGTYVTIGRYARRGGINRLTIAGRYVKVASVVHLRDSELLAQYAIAGNTIVATQRGSNAKRIGLYDYPAGGKPTAVFSGFYNPVQIAISSQ